MNPVAVGETISTLFSNMIFALGLVHCDPVSAHWIDFNSMSVVEALTFPNNPPIQKNTRAHSTLATS